MNKKTMQGVTLFELLFAVAIVAVVLGIGVPNLRTVIQSSRMTSTTNDLVAGLHVARTEAVKRRANTMVCSSGNPTAVPPACGGNFGTGWIVFVDRNGNGLVEVNADPLLDDTVVQTHAAPGNININADGGGFVSFGPTGFTRVVPGLGAVTANMVICDDRGNQDVGAGNSSARLINVSVTGRPQSLRMVADVAGAGGCP